MALLNGLVYCGEHGFPMVSIGPDYVCVAEYLDSIIGSRRVTAAYRGEDQRLYVEFESGWRMPLLCYCCGEPLSTGDPRAFGRTWRGRVVEAFVTSKVSAQELSTDRDVDVIGIVFSGREPEEDRTLEVGLRSVQELAPVSGASSKRGGPPGVPGSRPPRSGSPPPSENPPSPRRRKRKRRTKRG